MSNTHYVCFTCRTAVRRAKQYRHFGQTDEKSPRCPHCARACFELADQIPLPPKRKTKDWQTLLQTLRQRENSEYALSLRYRTRRLHELEKQAEALALRLQTIKNNPAYAKQLRREIAKTQQEYTGWLF